MGWGGGGAELIPEKLGGDVWPTSQNPHPIYDLGKYKLYRAVVDCVNNGEKAAFSKKHTQSANTVLYLRPKSPKLIPYLRTTRLKNLTLWARTYLHSPYKGVPPPPHQGICRRCFCYLANEGCFHLREGIPSRAFADRANIIPQQASPVLLRLRM